MTGLAYLEDSDCYAGGRVVTGRVYLAGQDDGERGRRREIPWSSRLGVEASDQHCNSRKIVLYLKTIYPNWISTETT